MPSKRKRDILDGFDPNRSDPEDENFNPTEDRPRRSAKKSRPSKTKKIASTKRTKYRGSDIEDDEELSDSEADSFGEDDEDEEEEEDDDDEALLNATGRRMRKAATKQQSYRESSEDSVIADSEAGGEEAEQSSEEAAPRPSRIVVLRSTNLSQLRNRRGKEVATPSVATRRSTRARTEETEEQLVELSNSGKHALAARSSRSGSPEAIHRTTRSTRGGKGVKKMPAAILEATQETEPKTEPEDLLQDQDEIAGYPEDAQVIENDDEVNEDVGAMEVEDAPEENLAAEEQRDENQAADDDEDEDVAPITRRTRSARTTSGAAAPEEADDEAENAGTSRRLTRKSGMRKSVQSPSSDFEPGDESGAEESGSEAPPKDDDADSGAVDNADDSSSPTPRGRRAGQSKSSRSRRNQDSGDEEVELDKDEMAEELEELRQSSRSRPRRRRQRSPSIQYEEPLTKRRRVTKPVDYSIKAIDPAAFEVEDEEPAATPQRGGRRGGRNGANQVWERNFNTTYGPFGGGGGAGSLLNGPWGTGATGGVDSDSSDDEMVHRSGVGGPVGMTPTTAAPPVGLFGVPAQTHNDGGVGGIGGATPNVGKIKSQKAFADADPLGVDTNVDFSKVGGLQGHIDQLKEMVQLPLLYPELFLKFHVTPPRGVLFHGPPGTGKTLLARALANSVGSGGRKITFYMRKGADALSKWVGEAEKQLRLLFEEARRTQPSIIFFDEIDGLAPVRSSKQEQIHASIVSTLLALMDGMDGRGQVIVIGATNRPDNIDPALRRPGRFDREFYFPLPDVEGRRSILDIHTKDWGLTDEFRNALAERTKGYGGADLRALCTEAALNAIQRTYPQIYSSKEKLIVDPDKISIHATDFIISIKKLIPSSERSTVSAAIPLPKAIEPLLRSQFKAIVKSIDEILPRKKKITALEEAMFEQPKDTDHGFGREALQQEFERSRIFRPRLLIAGKAGMGQNYLSAAILHHLEGVHVVNFDLATLLGDGRPLEQVIVGLFSEVKRHKPSVIYVPDINTWWSALQGAATTTFATLLRSIPPTDPVLLLATAENEIFDLDPKLLVDLFGFSKKNRAVIDRPNKSVRVEYFTNIIEHLQKAPTDFPDPADRKRRVLEVLPVAPPPPPRTLTKAEIKAQRKADLHSLNILKTRLQPIMDQIHRKYRKFRQPVIPLAHVAYLFDESDPNYVRPDLAEGEQRPYEIARDKEGTEGLRDTATGKFFYNLETTTIEERLANGYYARPRDFYLDINKLYNDAKNIGDRERALKANELRTNVEVDVTDIEQQLTNLGIKFDELYQRQLRRVEEQAERARKRQAMQSIVDLVTSDVAGDNDSDSQGPVGVGFPPAGRSTTGARFQVMSPHSNGHGAITSDSHPLTNGNSVPSRQDGEDTQMAGMDEETQPDSMGPPSFWPKVGSRQLGESTRATAGNTQVSQVSAITSVPPGMSPSAIVNDASTTKTSDPSTNRESGPWSTQATNGFHSNPEQQQLLLQQSQQSQALPDTQSQAGAGSGGPPSQSTSDEQWPHSQAHGLLRGAIKAPMGGGGPFGGTRTSPTSSQVLAPPDDKPRRPSAVSMAHILNDDGNSGGSSGSGNQQASSASASAAQQQPPSSIRNSGTSTMSSSQQQQPVINEASVADFLETIAGATSGCTIEQLEQISRELMDEIWRTRAEWNRMRVLGALTRVFNDTIADIETIQGLARLGEGGAGCSQEGEGEAEGGAETFVYLR